ncbi:c-type cytochrome biogenesis protein CcsB [Rhodococcus aerolatus]
MPIDPDLSRYSDLAFGSALVVYVLALGLLLAEFAGLRTRVTAAAGRTSELVGASRGTTAAAGPGSTPARPAGPGRVVVEQGRPLAERLGRTGIALTGVGLALAVASLVLRGLSAGRVPWGNMYEFTALVCAVTVAAWLVVLRRWQVRPLTVFVLLPVVVLMFVAGTVLYARSAPVVPALRSYWLAIHVSVIATASGVLLVSGVASAMFLLRTRFPEGSEPTSRLGLVAARLPGATLLDRVAYRTAIFGFPLFTAGVILGAIWAEAAWGRFWGWDPKEVAAFVTWVVYAAYLHARATAGWRNGGAAWVNIAGAVVIVFNLFVINMVVSGLHSYAGLN